MARKIVVRKTRRIPDYLSVPVNVKVAGQRTMLKSVTLTLDPNDFSKVSVHTGRRGRPAKIALSDIERVRVL